MGLLTALDGALDRSVVLGYSRVGPLLRRRWWPADPEPDALRGRHVVVTGATSGIGEATARRLAGLGATTHLLGRTPDKVDRVCADLRVAVPHAEVVAETCDVGDLDAVAAWCDDLAARVPALHGLVHNAGVLPAERAETPQGHEVALAAHVLGPHLMTERLLGPLTEAGRDGGASVVWMSSGGMYTAGLDDDLESRRGRFDGVRVYARTKRMQVVLAEAWARRLAGTGVAVASMHPGWVGTPGITDGLPGFARLTAPLLRDADGGADTAVWLVATRPATPGPRHFWHDRAARPTTYPWQRAEDAAAARAFLARVSEATGTDATWAAA